MIRGSWVQIHSLYEIGPKKVAEELKQAGFNEVYSGPTVEETEDIINKFIQECRKRNIKFYCGLEAFNVNTGEIYSLAHVLDRANYLDNKLESFDGFMFDYIRFPTFSFRNILRYPEITRKISIIRETFKKRYLLKAAVKCENWRSKWGLYFNGLRYGVRYDQIAQYLDAVCPMSYTRAYGVPNIAIGSVVKWLQEFTGNKCQPILQAYHDPKESPSWINPQDKDSLRYELILAKARGINGYSFFRYDTKEWRYQFEVN